MLTKLQIKNYALIEELDLDLQGGMNVITGETGAGKSILLGALGLILGQRADQEALLDKKAKCIIEGTFSPQGKSQSIHDYLSENELYDSNTIIIRREVNPEGRSRSFINDIPVTLQQLKEFGNLLVDIHSQHQTLNLNKSEFQLSVLDAIAGCIEEVKTYQIFYKKWLQVRNSIRELEERENKVRAEQDYLDFQSKELDEAGLKEGEQEQLEQELSALNNASDIQLKLHGTVSTLSGEDGLLGKLTHLNQSIQSLSKFDSELESISSRLKSVLIELKDIDSVSQDISEKFNPDPSRQSAVESRLDLIYRLQKKHRANSIPELKQIEEDVNKRLAAIGSLSDELEQSIREEYNLHKQLQQKAIHLTKVRSAAAPALEKSIRSMLQDVSLPNAIFSVEISQAEGGLLSPYGQDHVRFLFSANKGILPAEIGKVASGGELSRLMLCIKAAVASKMELPTMIFDEIDTGVSGETALRLGSVMKKLSAHHQLITITHLPQIAGQGTSHYFVHKKNTSGRTLTTVTELKKDNRLKELARMLSGDNPTAAAMANAKELLHP
jgi:DNA repair protein RecN (Recombination protein N)